MWILTNAFVLYMLIQIPPTLFSKYPKHYTISKLLMEKNGIRLLKNGKCKGKFAVQPLYEKGTDILDFNRQGNSFMNYELTLDVLITEGNTFQSNTISEEDFNE